MRVSDSINGRRSRRIVISGTASIRAEVGRGGVWDSQVRVRERVAADGLPLTNALREPLTQTAHAEDRRTHHHTAEAQAHVTPRVPWFRC